LGFCRDGRRKSAKMAAGEGRDEAGHMTMTAAAMMTAAVLA
jgi:hypothetical protein